MFALLISDVINDAFLKAVPAMSSCRIMNFVVVVAHAPAPGQGYVWSHFRSLPPPVFFVSLSCFLPFRSFFSTPSPF